MPSDRNDEKIKAAQKEHGLHENVPLPIPGMAPGVGSFIIRAAQIDQVLSNPEAATKMNFDQAFTRLMEFEGGGEYHSTPGDPGGGTKFGISKRAFPNLNIPQLTEDQAKLIYRTHYWDQIKAEELPEGLRSHVFDAAVNQGVEKASLLLQRAVNLYAVTRGGPGVAQDGKIGPNTIKAVNSYDADRLTTLFRHLRREEYVRLAQQGRGQFLFGWLKRA